MCRAGRCINIRAVQRIRCGQSTWVTDVPILGVLYSIHVIFACNSSSDFIILVEITLGTLSFERQGGAEGIMDFREKSM
jgi:hypothetical protein